MNRRVNSHLLAACNKNESCCNQSLSEHDPIADMGSNTAAVAAAVDTNYNNKSTTTAHYHHERQLKQQQHDFKKAPAATLNENHVDKQQQQQQQQQHGLPPLNRNKESQVNVDTNLGKSINNKSVIMSDNKQQQHLLLLHCLDTSATTTTTYDNIINENDNVVEKEKLTEDREVSCVLSQSDRTCHNDELNDKKSLAKTAAGNNELMTTSQDEHNNYNWRPFSKSATQSSSDTSHASCHNDNCLQQINSPAAQSPHSHQVTLGTNSSEVKLRRIQQPEREQQHQHHHQQHHINQSAANNIERPLMASSGMAANCCCCCCLSMAINSNNNNNNNNRINNSSSSHELPASSASSDVTRQPLGACSCCDSSTCVQTVSFNQNRHQHNDDNSCGSSNRSSGSSSTSCSSSIGYAINCDNHPMSSSLGQRNYAYDDNDDDDDDDDELESKPTTACPLVRSYNKQRQTTNCGSCRAPACLTSDELLMPPSIEYAPPFLNGIFRAGTKHTAPPTTNMIMLMNVRQLLQNNQSIANKRASNITNASSLNDNEPDNLRANEEDGAKHKMSKCLENQINSRSGQQTTMWSRLALKRKNFKWNDTDKNNNNNKTSKISVMKSVDFQNSSNSDLGYEVINNNCCTFTNQEVKEQTIEQQQQQQQQSDCLPDKKDLENSNGKNQSVISLDSDDDSIITRKKEEAIIVRASNKQQLTNQNTSHIDFNNSSSLLSLSFSNETTTPSSYIVSKQRQYLNNNNNNNNDHVGGSSQLVVANGATKSHFLFSSQEQPGAINMDDDTARSSKANMLNQYQQRLTRNEDKNNNNIVCNNSELLIGRRLITPRPKYPNNTILAELTAEENRSKTWLWPANFQSKSIPEPLLNANLSLTVEEYKDILSILNNDLRFNIHLILYKRIYLLWLILTLLGFLALVLSNLQAVLFYAIFTTWLAVQTLSLLACRLLRSKLNHMLEKSIAQVNGFLLSHNLMLGSLDRGGLIVTNPIIPIIYFDTSQCREHIESIIEKDCKTRDDEDTILNYSRFDWPYLAPKQLTIIERSRLAKKIILRYSQRWILMFDKKKLSFTSQVSARHLSTGKCFCQFIEDQFSFNTDNTVNKQFKAHLRKSLLQPPTSLSSPPLPSPILSNVNHDKSNLQKSLYNKLTGTGPQTNNSIIQQANANSCNILMESGYNTGIEINNDYKKQKNGLLSRISPPSNDNDELKTMDRRQISGVNNCETAEFDEVKIKMNQEHAT